MKPSHEEIEQRIYQAVAGLVEIGDRPLTPETSFEDIGLNSLAVVTLTFELEDQWGITIPNEILGDFRTVAEARDTVLELLAQARG